MQLWLNKIKINTVFQISCYYVGSYYSLLFTSDTKAVCTKRIYSRLVVI